MDQHRQTKAGTTNKDTTRRHCQEDDADVTAVSGMMEVNRQEISLTFLESGIFPEVWEELEASGFPLQFQEKLESSGLFI